MSDEPVINRHTGRPVDAAEGMPGAADDPARPAEGAGAAFAADAMNAPGGQASARGPAPASASPATGDATRAPSQQELAIRAALETVLDPEIGLSVVDLGLIREIHLLQDPPRTHVKMMLTTPFCPYAPQLMAEVKQATESVVPQPCEVEIMPDAWSPDLMADPGLLGFSF